MSEFIAEAQVLITPNTAAFAASLRKQLEAAVVAAGPVAIPIVAAPVAGELAGAQKAVAAQTAVATAAIAEETVALDVLGATATKTALSQKELAAAELRSARVHAQATRGLAAETLALGGLRGATLAASGPFLIGATAAIVFAKSIKEASDTTEELNKVAVVFGDSSEQIKAFSETTARSLGISEEAALQAAGVFGNLFRSISISEPVAADMSQRLVELAADLASFNNASPERTLEALRSGLVGQARPLRVFGIFLTQARAQQQALIDTGKDNIKQLTNAEIVQARFNLILKDSNLAQGDFARTSERLANQSRILKAQLSDLGGALGRQLLPALLNVVTSGNNVVRIFGDLQTFAGKAGEKVGVAGEKTGGFGAELARLLSPGAELKAVTGGLADALDRLAGNTNEATKSMSGFHFAIGGLPAEIAAMQAAANQVDLGNIAQELNALDVARLKLQTGLAPGGRPGEEGNIRAQIAKDKQAIQQTQSGTKARRDAILALKQDQDDLAALLEQDAQDAQDRASRIADAASKQEQAAREAAQAQADATQSFIDSFSGRAARLANRLTSAAQFGTAKTQIALNKLVIAADKAEIEAIQDRIRHLKLHGDALKLAQKTIQTLTQEIFDTRNAILQLQAERKQALVDARQTHLEAQLSIAETTESTRDDTAAEKALKKFDQQQIRRILAIKRRRRLTLDEAAQLDAFRVDLAQRNEALRKTKEEQDNTGKRMKELMFSFLQTQQGFAANLLGNLIPGFATKGLVGGSAPQPGQPMLAGPDDRAKATANVGATRAAGVRPVQVDTTNALLRQILAALNGRHTQPPEIRHNRATGSAVADTL